MTTSPSPAKRPLGSGFQLITLAPGGPYPLRLDAPFRHPEWTVRRDGKFNRPTYPGSALMIDEQWYEILDLDLPPRLPERFSYFLAPWEERFPLRKAYELTPEYLEGIAAAERERRRRVREAGALRYIPFLLGLLPAEDQEGLERNYGLSGNHNSMLTALFLLGFCMFVIMLAFADSQGMSFGHWTPLVKKLVPWVFLAMYLLVESMVRLRVTMNSREAIGSLPVAAPIIIVRTVVRTFSSEARTRAAVARELRAPPERLATARDEVRRLPDGRLEVLSRLPKKHWTMNVTGINFRGELYFLDVRETIKTPEGIRHRFELVVPEREMLWKQILEYRPEEVRDIYREERRVKAAMWVETFAYLWGFLDQETQARIEKSYNYKSSNKTRSSFLIAAVVSSLWLLGSFMAFQRGYASPFDGFTFLAAIYLLWETLVRRQRLAQGEVRGSVVGWFLKPLVLPSLKWGPKPQPVELAPIYGQEEAAQESMAQSSTAQDDAAQEGGTPEAAPPDVFPENPY